MPSSQRLSDPPARPKLHGRAPWCGPPLGKAVAFVLGQLKMLSKLHVTKATSILITQKWSFDANDAATTCLPQDWMPPLNVSQASSTCFTVSVQASWCLATGTRHIDILNCTSEQGPLMLTSRSCNCHSFSCVSAASTANPFKNFDFHLPRKKTALLVRPLLKYTQLHVTTTMNYYYIWNESDHEISLT